MFDNYKKEERGVNATGWLNKRKRKKRGKK
jgi:hypothetical protein